MIGDYGTFTLRHATLEDVHFMAPRLRKQDYDYLVDGDAAVEALEYGLNNGEAYTIEVSGEPTMLMGGGDVGDDTSSIWMVATPNIRKIRKDVVKYGREFALNLIGDNKYGYNLVSTKNHNVLRWLEKIGAIFGGTVQDNGKEFRIFTINK